MGLRKLITGILFRSKADLKIKGHDLIVRHKSLIFADIRKGDYAIEIGSDRDAGSTRTIALLCNRYGLNFISVDIDKEASGRAEKILSRINHDFIAVNDFGEKYLAEFRGPLHLVYLDAFDIPGDWHSEKVREVYSEKKLQLTLENCHRMHFDCAVSIAEKMPEGGFVCFDDVNPLDGSGSLIFNRVASDHIKWSGKGATAIPFLISKGFELVDNHRACALLKRTRKT